MSPSSISLALALNQLDQVLTPELAARLADPTLRIAVALAAIGAAAGQRLSPSCELLAQLHDVLTAQDPAA